MAFNEQLPEWNAVGVEPPASKKTEGWQPDDKPPADWFNWLFNRAYKVLNEIRDILGGHVDAAAPHSGHETPAGATAKASAAEASAKSYTDTHAGTKDTHGAGAGYYLAKTSRSDQLPAFADMPDKPTSFPPSSHKHSKSDISDFPTSMAPTAHKNTHASGGSDALSPADIGAVPISRNISTSGGLTGGGTLAADKSLSIADSGVTDAKIGNRTISDTAAPTGDTGNPTTLFGWLAFMIKSITGKSSWRTAPAKTIQQLADDQAAHLDDLATHGEILSLYRSDKDSNGVYTTLQWKRADGNLAKKSVLSGGTSPKYTTRTVTYYNAAGTTVILTKTYTETYTGDDLTSEVLS